MMLGRRSQWMGSIAIAVVSGVAIAELVVREMFNRVQNDSFKIAVLTVLTLVLIVLQWILDGKRRGLGRLPFVAACCVYIGSVLDTTYGGAHSSAWLSTLASNLWLAGAAVGIVLAWLLDDERWKSVQRAAVFAAVVFVGSQPVLVALRAPHLQWPPPSALAKPGGDGRDLTVFLLLDELNANRASPIIAALQQGPYRVEWQPIPAVGDGTSKVIPALFTQQDFSTAKACGVSATCSGEHVLDFHRVVASRPDVDVVGFFMPYCEIQGLRWCRRIPVESDLLDAQRWKCAIYRRTGKPASTSAAQCDEVFRHGWNAMVNSTLQTIWDAPTWTKGGMLYVHVPLPHPPGRLIQSSLELNYEDGVRRASELVSQMARRAIDGSGRRVTFVIFSDHPLRQSLWCKDQWAFSSIGCRLEPQLDDHQVPLIVASTDTLPSLDGVQNNSQVFSLANR